MCGARETLPWGESLYLKGNGGLGQTLDLGETGGHEWFRSMGAGRWELGR